MGIELPMPKSHDMRITEHISQLHPQRITRVEQGLCPVDALPDGHSGGRTLLERMGRDARGPGSWTRARHRAR